MQAGKLRNKFTLQKPDPDQEYRRGQKREYIDDRQVWGSFKKNQSVESVSNNQLKIVGTYIITIWNSGDIDESYRLISGDDIYSITEIVEADHLRHELTLTTEREK